MMAQMQPVQMKMQQNMRPQTGNFSGRPMNPRDPRMAGQQGQNQGKKGGFWKWLLIVLIVTFVLVVGYWVVF